jgi:hypothetical protein
VDENSGVKGTYFCTCKSWFAEKVFEPAIIPMNKIISDCTSTVKDMSIDDLRSAHETTSVLQKFLLQDIEKAEMEIESLQQSFKNLMDSHRDTINKKYSKITREDNTLSEETDNLTNYKRFYHKDRSELVKRLNVCIQNCLRENKILEYQFNFLNNKQGLEELPSELKDDDFKPWEDLKLSTVKNTAIDKIPRINLDEITCGDESDSKRAIRQMLHSMPGVVFESSVPLSDTNTISHISKIQSMVKSLR